MGLVNRVFSKLYRVAYDGEMITITDEQWKAVEAVMPGQDFAKGGRPRVSDRRTLAGILWVLKYGEQWSHLPKKYGSYVTCWRRFNEWEGEGVWPKIWRAYFNHLEHKEKLSWSLALWEGTIVPTKGGQS